MRLKVVLEQIGKGDIEMEEEEKEPKCFNCGSIVIKHDLLSGRCSECGCLIWPDGEEFDYTP